MTGCKTWLCRQSIRSVGQLGAALLFPAERRIPAILANDNHDAWLLGSTDDAFAALSRYPSDLMFAAPVSAKVNNVKNKGPEAIQPVYVSTQ